MSAVSLVELQAGEAGTILSLCCPQETLMRLTALGFIPGATVNVIRTQGHGPIIVNLLDTEIALGYAQAQSVSVRRVE